MQEFNPYSLEAYEAHVRHRRIAYGFAAWSLIWLIVYSLANFLSEGIANIATTMLTGGATMAVLKGTHYFKRFKLNWYLIGMMLGAWFLADFAWMTVYWLGYDPLAYEWIENIYTITNISMFSSAALYFVLNYKRWHRIQMALDLSISLFLLSIILFRLYFLGAQGVEISAHSLWTVGILIFTDVGTLLIMVAMLASTSIREISRTMLLLFMGFVVYVTADMWYVYQFIRDTYKPNGLMDVMYLVAFLLFASGAIHEVLYPSNAGIYADEQGHNYGTTNVVWVFLLVPGALTFLKYLTVMDFTISLIGACTYYFISHYLQKSMMVEALFEKERQLTLQLEYLVDERTQQLMEANRILEHKAKTDALTSLANRDFFLQRIDGCIVEELEDKFKAFSVIHVDIDHFKVVNDIHGHSMGDQVLLAIAEVITNLTDKQYGSRVLQVARIGGDEFGIILRTNSPIELKLFSEKLIAAVQKPINIGHYRFYFGATVGVARYPYDGVAVDALVKSADIAMSHAKKSNLRAKVAIYSDDLIGGIARRNQIEWLLHSADFNHDFSLHYQPQFCLKTGRLIGMEALIRWYHAEEGFISPQEFIPIAEENGMIADISAWVFETAMRQMRQWLETYPQYRVLSMEAGGPVALRMGINVSALLFNSVDFMPMLDRLCVMLKVQPQWFDLEITESGALNASIQVEGLFQMLSEKGYTISIDDFGTGYSALSYLKRFSVHTLKIAKELTDTLDQDDKDYLIRAIVMLAQGLELKTIAEGVETQEQLERLQALGCDAIQGYYKGRPCSPQDFEALYLT